jgi:hypothetical protein
MKLRITTEDVAQKILNDVPRYREFYFFDDIGRYSGTYANNLIVFSNKLRNINKTCFNFHFKRGDFEKWIRTTVGDRYLADQIAKINDSVDEDELLLKVYQIVEKRLNELKQLLANEEPYIMHDDDL